ncbi:MAG: LysR family transcriptional regulator, partial [Oscillospiraceae bacterium]|nr:LysR family transcriptional regulator [Oscillospiraceae bacterium]
VNDRATSLNLMVGLNGFTLCSGIICEELNGSDYAVIPFKEDENNKNSLMEIGYITKKQSIFSSVAEVYIAEVKKYLASCKV